MDSQGQPASSPIYQNPALSHHAGGGELDQEKLSPRSTLATASQFAFAPVSLTTLPQRTIALFTCASSCAGVELTIW